ncbi:hypothetical protein OQZ33_09515 [Pedobacter sp. MC2016-05]|uniref:hypothetical protein n=1 Tax=Pedobacter sp. MC2016-05 TaxID=2994474 RepID=UPI0022480E72|nr:hypothetical protein [Pedobacter sp. MC2016-05]MCX2474564.1 hypothetical protein [Pedobacter sp. MC2016-05]
MKKFIIIQLGLMLLFFAACKTEPDANAVKKEVLNIHDKLMMDGEKVVKNRIKLDSILKSGRIKSLEDSLKMANLINQLNKADERMMDWMHFFKDDFRGKNEQENMAYYKLQMIKVRAIEDQYIQVTKVSDSVLKNYNIKSVETTEMKNHKH